MNLVAFTQVMEIGVDCLLAAVFGCVAIDGAIRFVRSMTRG